MLKLKQIYLHAIAMAWADPNLLRKSGKMLSKPGILSLFPKSFN